MSRGHAWTDTEVHQAFDLQARGYTYAQIANRLGRSHGAVANKLAECRNPSQTSEAQIRRSSDRFAAAFAVRS